METMDIMVLIGIIIGITGATLYFLLFKIVCNLKNRNIEDIIEMTKNLSAEDYKKMHLEKLQRNINRNNEI